MTQEELLKQNEELRQKLEVAKAALQRVVKDNLHSDHYSDKVIQGADRGVTALQALKKIGE
jgi:hypothetical protein